VAADARHADAPKAAEAKDVIDQIFTEYAQ
jgi:hypothetical protein